MHVVPLGRRIDDHKSSICLSIKPFIHLSSIVHLSNHSSINHLFVIYRTIHPLIIYCPSIQPFIHLSSIVHLSNHSSINYLFVYLSNHSSIDHLSNHSSIHHQFVHLSNHSSINHLLVGGNYHLYFDNIFTSVSLLEKLERDNIYACGTFRKERNGIPLVIKNMKLGKLSRSIIPRLIPLSFELCVQQLLTFHLSTMNVL